MTPIDLSPADLETVLEILARHVPEYEVRAFGSRVARTARKVSDLDLAIITDRPLATARIVDLRQAFSESDLPFRVDLVDWAVTAQGFRRVVERDGRVIQRARRDEDRAGRGD